MKIEIDIDEIIKYARYSQEHAEDYSYPFFMGFDEAYPEVTDYIRRKLTDEYVRVAWCGQSPIQPTSAGSSPLLAVALQPKPMRPPLPEKWAEP